ncbi:MAG: flavodoxin family protein [Lachnospiraceae bacterium]|nr:flavodoxin family protein [Lachnospiraceae bacterium]
MRILVLNTIANQTKETQTLLQNIKEKYANATFYNTYEMDIKHCIGCNFCWLKTPGICTIKDDYETLLKEMLVHDEMIVISDTKFGFITHETKKLFDRILPLATMYLQFKGKQMRHVSRYDKKLKVALFYQGDGEKEYLNYWLDRATLNMEWECLGAHEACTDKEVLACI